MKRRKFIGTAAAGAAVAAPLIGTVTAAASPAAASAPGVRSGMVLDLGRCFGCKGCAVACKTELATPLGVFSSQVIELEEGSYPDVKRHFLPWLCNHCNNPPCIQRCPVDEIEVTETMVDGSTATYSRRATYKRPDGIVLVDNDRCIGCGRCVQDCPYNVRWRDPERRAGGNDSEAAVGKCTLCVHRLMNGVVPSCVNTCIARARTFGDLADPSSEAARIVSRHGGTGLFEDFGTGPNVRYVRAGTDVDEIRLRGEDIRNDV